jgi:hypothetical protein
LGLARRPPQVGGLTCAKPQALIPTINRYPFIDQRINIYTQRTYARVRIHAKYKRARAQTRHTHAHATIHDTHTLHSPTHPLTHGQTWKAFLQSHPEITQDLNKTDSKSITASPMHGFTPARDADFDIPPCDIMGDNMDDDVYIDDGA